MYRRLGGVQNVFRGPMYQQGYGLGGYFKKFFRWLMPIAERHVMPHIKSGIETVGKKAVESASRIANDTISGMNESLLHFFVLTFYTVSHIKCLFQFATCPYLYSP